MNTADKVQSWLGAVFRLVAWPLLVFWFYYAIAPDYAALLSTPVSGLTLADLAWPAIWPLFFPWVHRSALRALFAAMGAEEYVDMFFKKKSDLAAGGP